MSGSADINQDGIITAKELFTYAELELKKENTQIPSLFDINTQDFVISKVKENQILDIDSFDKHSIVNTQEKSPMFKKYITKKTYSNTTINLKLFIRNALITIDKSIVISGEKIPALNLISILEEQSIICLIGGSGTGKSYIIQELFQHYKEIANNNTIPIYFDLMNNNQTNLYIYIWKIIYKSFSKYITRESLQQFLKSHKIILLIDSLDELDTIHHPEFFDNLIQVQELAINTKVIIATRPTGNEYKFSIKCNFYEIQRLSINEIKKVLIPEMVDCLGIAGALELANTPLGVNILRILEKKYKDFSIPKTKEELVTDYLNYLIDNIAQIYKTDPSILAKILSFNTIKLYISVKEKIKLSKKNKKLLKLEGLLDSSDLSTFLHAELQAACASIYLTDKSPEFVFDLPSYQQKNIFKRDLAVYVAHRSKNHAEVFANYALEEFLLSKDVKMLLAAANIIKVSFCSKATQKKVINQIITVYDLREEKFYPMWKLLHPIVFTWNNPLLISIMKKYLLDGKLTPLKVNIFHHSYFIMNDETIADWLYSQYETFLSDRHMISSILEVMWLRKEIKQSHLLKDRFKNSKYIIEQSSILKCVESTKDNDIIKNIIGISKDSLELQETKNIIINKLLKYYETTDSDIEKGHVIIELSIHNEAVCRNILNSINLDKSSNTLRYHSYYALANLKRTNRYWRVQ